MSDTAVSSEEERDDGVWDDSLLIKAYSKAINGSKETIRACKPKGKCQSSPTSSNQTKENVSSAMTGKFWQVGMPCRAVYSEDGIEYEATIEEIDYENSTCTVVYVGYENLGVVDISTLKKSSGAEARKLQDQVKNKFKRESTPVKPQSKRFGFIPPPPTIPVLEGMPMDEYDAFSAMLMSWYMSGYHTGYYHGLKDRDTRRNSHPQSS